MPRGNWSFLQEWTIYDYLLARADEKTLRLKQVINKGRLEGRERWHTVADLPTISSTKFPDIDRIKLKGSKQYRPAEVKFVTSLFDYHKEKYQDKFNSFIEQLGFILVLRHDYLPPKLIEKYPQVDVYEIDLTDFISFCRENFSRLLNKQIRAHTETKVWLMYQPPNFNKGNLSLGIKPARESKIWCPTDNLTGFDLAVGDTVLFVKTHGASRIDVQNPFYKQQTINEKWVLDEIYIAEVSSKIYSRYEYCNYKKLKQNTQLWKNDSIEKDGSWHWGRVFEFKRVKEIKPQINIVDLYNTSASSRDFVTALIGAFCQIRSRELDLETYRNLLIDLI